MEKPFIIQLLGDDSLLHRSCYVSYWIFAWYVLYMFNLTKYNPKIWLIILSISVLIISLIILYYKNYKSFFLCILFNIIIKVIPILSIWNTKTLMRDF